MVDSDMDELPLSEQRYQSFFFDNTVEYSGHADFLGGFNADPTPDEERDNQPLNDHLYFLPWFNQSVSIAPPTASGRTQGARSRDLSDAYGPARWADNPETNEAVIYGDSVYLCLKTHEDETAPVNVFG